jgi:hypothetical protein
MRIKYLQFLLLLLLFMTGCARKNYFATTPVVDQDVYKQLQETPETIDSVTVKAGKHYKKGFLHRLFWGTHYRPVWNAPVTVPVLDMSTVKGGLKVDDIGGGFQTTSVKLVDSTGFTYALRSLDKDPIGVVPEFWRKTVVANILRDQTTAINPYASLVVPVLAKAAHIPHSTPSLYYVKPNDTSFGKYTDKISNRLMMLEEKYNDKRSLTPMFGDAVDIVDSKKLLNERFGDSNHFIDQLAFAKARLFDLLIHDWDRHEGQWEWAKYEKGKENFYRPIPKDRDNVFFHFQDGIIPWIFSRNWAIRKFESFDKDFNDVKALMINSEFIDQRALSQVTRQQLDSLAKQLQIEITDAVIEQATSRFPDSVYKLIGESTTEKLKSRRDQLPLAAKLFYENLAKEVLVIGTDKEDKFEVKRLNDQETEVIVYRKSDDKVTYRRIFNTSETKHIKLVGLAEDDEFILSGKVNKGILVSIQGGRGEDEIDNASNVKGRSKKTRVYDTKIGTKLNGGPDTKDNRKNDVRIHGFDREGY